MLKFLPYNLIFFWISLFGQSNTDIFVTDYDNTQDEFTILNVQNISNNPGYDNQPYFAKELLLYAGNDSGQTEIFSFDLNNRVTKKVNTPTPGGEYSPQSIPDHTECAAVRLDNTGLQRLYHYDENGDSRVLIEDLEVAYFAFYDKNTVLTSVLSEDRLDLVLVDLRDMEKDTLLLNSGRSIHKIPGNSGMSYTSVNEDGNLEIYQLDIESRQSFFITQLPIGVQDHTWLDDSKILIGSNSSLFLYDLYGDSQWIKIADLSKYNLKNITRIAASPDKKKLALVAEPIQ